MPRPDLVYALIILAAVAAAVVQWLAPDGLRLSRRQRVGLGAFAGAMPGAKLPILPADWPGMRSGRAWFDNGKTILFGMAGGYVGVEIARAACDVRGRTGDAFAPPVAAVALLWACDAKVSCS